MRRGPLRIPRKIQKHLNVNLVRVWSVKGTSIATLHPGDDPKWRATLKSFFLPRSWQPSHGSDSRTMLESEQLKLDFCSFAHISRSPTERLLSIWWGGGS